jgi:hypothetical protein
VNRNASGFRVGIPDKLPNIPALVDADESGALVLPAAGALMLHGD